jgi:multidrug efflux system outer membrane protein
MKRNKSIQYIILGSLTLLLTWGCRVPAVVLKTATNPLPEHFQTETDTINIARISWANYFQDPYLIALIDTALQNNQELNIFMQEIQVSNNEILERQGEYLPFVDAGAKAGMEKVARYTRNGAVEHELEIEPDREFPEPFLGDINIGAVATWEVDIWRKLRNAKDAAQLRYLAATEGRNFLVTNLIAEIADAYYELMALDNQLIIIDNNLITQADALRKVKLQMQNAKATQLAVNRFEAQLLKTKNLQYAVRQSIVETENKIHFLTGKYPSNISRNSEEFMNLTVDTLASGIPAQLLGNRPDIRQAEHQLAAAELDVKVARAEFYPKLDISSELGFQAFNPVFLIKPQSLLFDLAGDIMAPMVNRKAIAARFNTAKAMQIQTVYQYEQTLLNAYTDVLNQLAKLDNYSNSFETKAQEVEILNKSVGIANSLYRNARADYVEVLLTQEEVLDAKTELVETKLNQLHAKVQIYRALGGGWQ